MNMKNILSSFLGCGLLYAAGCDDISPADQGAAEAAYKDAVVAQIGEQITEIWGADSPPDACASGAVLCRGTDPGFSPLVCHECDELCKGTGNKSSWSTDDPINCPQQKRTTTFTINFSISVLSIGAAQASAGTKMDIWSTAMKKAALGAPIPGAAGKNPEQWTNWITVYDADFKTEGEIKIGYLNDGVDANLTVESSYEDKVTGIRRCNSLDGGQVCDGEVGVPPHGGSDKPNSDGPSQQPQGSGQSDSAPGAPQVPGEQPH
ncbi:MAG: hypothetical protein K0V04_24300 [Deltaproteobacteria bacterium]|nr:hypothetical protein [Deltaproteobacteria bacterium]